MNTKGSFGAGASQTSRHPKRIRDQSPLLCPTFPNEKAKGLIKGKKIDMVPKPANYNIMGELDLRGHFLKKLNELRFMKEEYYGAPEEKTAFEVLAERQ